MAVKAFGKFTPGKALPMRRFEVQLKVKARYGPNAWMSDMPSVQRLLDHLGRYTQSESSREKYLRHLHQFSIWSNHSPEELIKLLKRKAEQMIQKFVDELAEKERRGAYTNSTIKRLRTFFRVNGYTGNKELKVQSYFVPTRYRKVEEYIPTKMEVFAMVGAAGSLRNRAVILMLWSSDLRVSTLCSLNYGDVAEELEEGEPYVRVPVSPALKTRLPDACKSLIPYYSFLCQRLVRRLGLIYAKEERNMGDTSGRSDTAFGLDALA